MPLSPNEFDQIADAVLKKMQSDFPVFRDSRDVSTISSQRKIIGIMAGGMVIVCVIAFVLFLRKPDLITAQTTPDGRRVTQINNRDYGCTEAIELGKDNLSNDDKTYLANQFAARMYGVYLPSRDKDIERALRLIEDKNFLKSYATQLADGQLQAEKNEQWSAVWTPLKISVDENNPMVVRIIGTQDLTRSVNNETKQSQIQYQLTFRLTTDGRRTDENLRTGFKILQFAGEELSRTDS